MGTPFPSQPLVSVVDRPTDGRTVRPAKMELAVFGSTPRTPARPSFLQSPGPLLTNGGHRRKWRRTTDEPATELQWRDGDSHRREPGREKERGREGGREGEREREPRRISVLYCTFISWLTHTYRLEVLQFRHWIRLRSRIYGHFGIPIPILVPGFWRSGSTLDPDPPLDLDPVSIQI